MTARIVLTLAATLTLSTSTPARACIFPPAVRVRASLPADGDTAVPTSVRVRVSYLTGAQGITACGPGPGAPTLRIATATTDGGVRDAGTSDGGIADGGSTGSDAGSLTDGGTPIAGQWTMATDDDPRNGVTWEFRATGLLQPRTAYELVDTLPDIGMCGGGASKMIAPMVFARFTTRDTPDQTPPTFGGLNGISCQHESCGISDDTCCGPYDHLRLSFSHTHDQRDDVAVVGVHLYLRAEGAKYDFTRPLGPLTVTDPSDSATAPRWSVTLPPGLYHVLARAFDTSGNEDSNQQETMFRWPLASEPLCATANSDANRFPMDLRQAPEDMSASQPAHDASVAPAASSSGSCGCVVGGGRSRSSTALAALLALGLALSVAARRRSRRGGRAERP